MANYKTIARQSEGRFTEQRSKFLSFAVPVQTPEDAKNTVAEYRKKYYDARHVCWAYMLGAERLLFRANDDGEPSSTAGKPILGVINSHELTDILIIVVRYFGGVKLGTSGLIVAYRAAAQDAIAKAEIIEKTEEEEISIRFSYANLNRIMKIVKEENLTVISQNFDNECEMIIRAPKSECYFFARKLSQIK
jgi:uncharacterized YigZ family protein